MDKFVIDPIIKEQFLYYQNMCSLLSEFKDSVFASPATLEEIEHWEKANDTTLPHQYKSWLMLTKNSRILDGYIEFEWPGLGTLDDKDDIIVFASIIGDGETAYISRSDGKIFSIFEGQIKKYADFDDFLTIQALYIESMAEDFLGEKWGELYDERFESLVDLPNP